MKKYIKKDIQKIKKKKILIVTACDISNGGVSVFLYNILSHIKCDELCIHIYFPGEIISQAMADKFSELGIVLYIGGCSSGDSVREIAYKDLECLASSNNYDVIHSNSGKVWINYYSCYFGVKNNIPVRIVHSHSAMLPRKKAEVQKQDDSYRQFILENATDFLACSVKAARWLFGEKFQNYTIFKNGIDLEKYEFNINTRKKYREELNLNNKFVVGHVGRFVKAKNHEFILKIFKEIIKRSSDCVLLMAGNGELLEDIKEKSISMGINSNCIFLGGRMDIPELLNAMDIFIFPSIFEGFGISLLEAQANGLPCLMSNKITEEVCLLKDTIMMPLENSEEFWAEQVLKYKMLHKERKIYSQELREAGYSIEDSAGYLWKLYKG